MYSGMNANCLFYSSARHHNKFCLHNKAALYEIFCPKCKETTSTIVSGRVSGVIVMSFGTSSSRKACEFMEFLCGSPASIHKWAGLKMVMTHASFFRIARMRKGQVSTLQTTTYLVASDRLVAGVNLISPYIPVDI